MIISFLIRNTMDYNDKIIDLLDPDTRHLQETSDMDVKKAGCLLTGSRLRSALIKPRVHYSSFHIGLYRSAVEKRISKRWSGSATIKQAACFLYVRALKHDATDRILGHVKNLATHY